jgi:hypothetical protein
MVMFDEALSVMSGDALWVLMRERVRSAKMSGAILWRKRWD